MRDDTYAALKDVLARSIKLLARIEREEGKRHDPEPRDGPLGIVFDRRALRVWVDDQEVVLTTTEMKIFMLLLDHEGEVVTHEVISEMLSQNRSWLGEESRTAFVHIGRLRQKLERYGSEPRRIISVRGFGYRFENTPR